MTQTVVLEGKYTSRQGSALRLGRSLRSTPEWA
jgi:hypothetical protein